ncbi:hypothetical protein [Desulfosediminicola flagellatus]|uniref:hypothetical protein n=1 Tax=Desulfosediminicola flagellatus TaxID=2569541 RepID=UPI0010AC28E9|nr:hypothetical protein [Desulfosediminicola flagellatus]
MKAPLIALLFSLLLLSSPPLVMAASDCSGPWQVMKNRGGVAPCQALGLDSNRGTCRPGDMYETFCDDIKGGKYRTCQGPRRCGGNQQPQQNRGDCTYWDYDYNRPCPQGYRNMDCRGGCDKKSHNQEPCKNWDYNYNQPCPNGYINYDCRGGCEPRY